MQVEVDIAFEQLVQLAKKLPTAQWTQLKKAVDTVEQALVERKELEMFLLGAPTFSKKQLEAINKARQEINQWRTK
ncbi:MAG: hypothetical protein EAZ47_09160 [Bacteroidetes bacterium]|nr:MAG: hypothetical protein EAY72_06835 [Bacteroidota bacterium]TAE62031.1 MAG: hypothetical protein EAY68_09345 [Bacteroidota bacterium]TAF92037.1 MAG: hypothetical protein EAZ47_09160 [Bacteroidota bacterium]